MISRKENLLVRPWQQKRYDNHRRKVQSARPAIDTGPPLPRQHVALKLKKRQIESERIQDIEKNNFNLLKRLSYVMRTSRVDNYWTTPQPNFLNRVSMYEMVPKFDGRVEEREETPEKAKGRKAKCTACTPQPVQEIKISEERVPWEPEKPSIARARSKSVPVRKIEVEKSKVPRSADVQKIKTPPQYTKVAPKSGKVAPKPKFSAKEPQSIILSRGCLKLSVNFPSDTLVKLQEGTQEKILLHNVCNCRNVIGVVN